MWEEERERIGNTFATFRAPFFMIHTYIHTYLYPLHTYLLIKGRLSYL